MRAGTLTLTLTTLIAFAANSVLCRMALKADLIDPVSFTEIRLISGAFTLAPILFARRGSIARPGRREWGAAFALFVYAIAFSLAYTRLGAGTGALLLFGAVQVSMIGFGMARGHIPGAMQWAGLALAFAGLVYLVLPGLSAPPIAAAASMATAGLAWGAYSLLGKGERDPVAATARNFAFAAPFALALIIWPAARHISFTGIALAVSSGAFASALGYVIWYRALKGLSPVSAAVVQLAVPVIAAFGGILFIDEKVTLRLVIAAALILGGIFLAIRAGAKRTNA